MTTEKTPPCSGLVKIKGENDFKTLILYNLHGKIIQQYISLLLLLKSKWWGLHTSKIKVFRKRKYLIWINSHRCHSYQWGWTAESHHEDVMEHHEQLLSQVTPHSSSHWPDASRLLFVTFDPLLVPVTQKHGVDVVGKVRCGKEDVAVSQPVSEEETEERRTTSNVSRMYCKGFLYSCTDTNWITLSTTDVSD